MGTGLIPPGSANFVFKLSYMFGIGGSNRSSGTFGRIGPVPGGYKP
jgi:hypothetical protein